MCYPDRDPNISKLRSAPAFVDLQSTPQLLSQLKTVDLLHPSHQPVRQGCVFRSVLVERSRGRLALQGSQQRHQRSMPSPAAETRFPHSALCLTTKGSFLQSPSATRRHKRGGGLGLVTRKGGEAVQKLALRKPGTVPLYSLF